MKFDAEHWLLVIAIALWATSCSACGSAFWNSYNRARGDAFAACVEAHRPSECLEILP